MTQYKRAPITEAAIEIRLEQPLPDEAVAALRTRLKQEYLLSETLSAVDVKVDMKQRQATFDEPGPQFKLSSADRSDGLMISSVNMVCSRFAPYNGWEEFRERVARDWAIWKRTVGYQKIQRIGVRYINRIDIPLGGEGGVKVEDYLKVFPEYPENDFWKSLHGYTMQLSSSVDEGKFLLNIITSNVKSPLVDHLSLLLDVDLWTPGSPPQKDDEIFAMLDLIRGYKNRIFEECITDKSRKLFDK